MREQIRKWRKYHPNIIYRGTEANRVDNLTDAVFGIAITLLIFNLSNPNSFEDLMLFAKTLPAFLISISSLVLVWKEHYRFSEVYGINDNWLLTINTLFLALVIFYVYPLRFLTLYLTSFFFGVNSGFNISGKDVPYLMIYYGFLAFGLYFCIWLLYWRANKLRDTLDFNAFEQMYTKAQMARVGIMFAVPLFSVGICFTLKNYNPALASILSGMFYAIYSPLMVFWQRGYRKKEKPFLNGQNKE